MAEFGKVEFSFSKLLPNFELLKGFFLSFPFYAFFFVYKFTYIFLFCQLFFQVYHYFPYIWGLKRDSFRQKKISFQPGSIVEFIVKL